MAADSFEPGNYPLTMRRGVHFGPITLVVRNGAMAIINLTGYTARGIARTEIPSPNELDLDPDITNAAGGIVTIEFTDAETDQLFPVGTYRYDITLETGGEIFGPVLSGVLTVEDHPSRT